MNCLQLVTDIQADEMIVVESTLTLLSLVCWHHIIIACLAKRVYTITIDILYI